MLNPDDGLRFPQIFLDRRPRCLNALDRQRALVQRVRFVAGGILDRQPGDSRGNRARDIDGDFFRLVRKTAFEIGVDGQVDGIAQRGEMFADVVDRDAVVGAADRPRIASAGGGDRFDGPWAERL